MHLRTLLIAALCIGLNSSLCTGGIFAVGAAISNQLAFTEDSGLMSYGSIGILSCKNNKRSGQEMGSVEMGGCKNASACFTQATSILEERITAALFAFTEYIPMDFFVFPVERNPPNSILLARAGPLYEHSISTAHSLEKLE